ncbi:MAG: ABC transporter substrate-binding protein/permease, partial [Polyangia bacterium]
MNHRRAWLLLGLAAAGWSCAAGPDTSSAPDGDEAATTALARVHAAGVLRWGGDQQGGEPYVFDDPQRPGTVVGFEVDLAQALARELGVSARFVQNDWSTLIPSLERGSFDVALNGIEVTPALQGRVAFSRPYFVFVERLVGRRGDARIHDLASLRGLRVGTLAATQAWHTLQESGAQAIPYEGVDEPFIDLESGRTDAVLLDDIIVDRYLPRHPRLQAIADVGWGQYAAAFRREDAGLREALDRALGTLAGTGELHRILGRWDLDNRRQARLEPRQELRLEQPLVPTSRQLSTGDGFAATGSPADASDISRRSPGQMPFAPGHALLFLQAALVTLLISTAAMAVAAPLGLLLALVRLYRPRLRWLASMYIEVFRGTPVLLQLYVLYYGMAPLLRLNAPAAAILGLGLNYAAYEAEIYRAGIAAVPRGQMEAAVSLGMTRALALRRIVLPQAMRVALPGMTNDFISLLKDSSLVSVITVIELTKRMSITAVDTRGWLLPGL